MRVPEGRRPAGVRVRAQAHQSSPAASSACNAMPMNQLGIDWSILSRAVGWSTAGPGAHSLTLEAGGLRLLVHLDRNGARLASVETSG